MRRELVLYVLPVGVLATLAALFVDGIVRARADVKWTKSLRRAAAGADRLVVEDLDWHGRGTRPDFEIRGNNAIRELFEVIDVDAAGSGFHCMCDGQYWIHIYRADQEVMTIGCHHGRSLRWHGGEWNGDGLLTAASQEALPRWFKDKGYPALQDEREAALKEEKRRLEAIEGFASQFPAEARMYIGHDNGSSSDSIAGDAVIGRKLATAVGNPRRLAVAVCRAFGTLHGGEADWSSTGGKERRALAAIHTVGVEDFVAALGEIQQDRNALRGAARIYFFEGFQDKIDPKVRTEWTSRLAEIVLDEDSDSNKQIVLGYLGRIDSSQVRELLHRVLRGELGKEIDRSQAWDDEPGLRAGAAIMLAMQGDGSIRAECEQLLASATTKQDTAALEVCLALLGNPSYLNAEHFQLESYHIGLGELKAIERFAGRFGMEALVKGGIHHPWGRVRDEALETFERITGKKMAAKEIEDWWQVEHDARRDRQ